MLPDPRSTLTATSSTEDAPYTAVSRKTNSTSVRATALPTTAFTPSVSWVRSDSPRAPAPPRLRVRMRATSAAATRKLAAFTPKPSSGRPAAMRAPPSAGPATTVPLTSSE